MVPPGIQKTGRFKAMGKGSINSLGTDLALRKVMGQERVDIAPQTSDKPKFKGYRYVQISKVERYDLQNWRF